MAHGPRLADYGLQITNERIKKKKNNNKNKKKNSFYKLGQQYAIDRYVIENSGCLHQILFQNNL